MSSRHNPFSGESSVVGNESVVIYEWKMYCLYKLFVQSVAQDFRKKRARDKARKANREKGEENRCEKRKKSNELYDVESNRIKEENDDDFDNDKMYDRPLVFKLMALWSYTEIIILVIALGFKEKYDYPSNIFGTVCTDRLCDYVIPRALSYKLLSTLLLLFGSKFVSVIWGRDAFDFVCYYFVNLIGSHNVHVAVVCHQCHWNLPFMVGDLFSIQIMYVPLFFICKIFLSKSILFQCFAIIFSLHSWRAWENYFHCNNLHFNRWIIVCNTPVVK